MRKLLILVLLALACSEEATKVAPVTVGKDNRPPRCVVPPLPSSPRRTVPVEPDRTPAIGKLPFIQPFDRIGQSTDFNVLVLLVDFPDKPLRTNPAYFDDLFFADTGHTFKTYYKEQSYGAFNSVTQNQPSDVQVLRLPNPYSFYTGGNYGFNSFPGNGQGMATDAIRAADAVVDFGKYDNDGDGSVDGVIIIHAGSGAELTGQPSDIWSHQWSFPALTVDGKTITDYCTAPEYWTETRAMQIGVIVHEAGHLYFNQIDEYGTSGLWQGLGRHCCMAGGSYNGLTGLGDDPAPFCPPSQVRAGFNTPIPVDTPGFYTVPQGVVLRYGTATENIYIGQARQAGFNLPGSGLLFIHGKANISGMYYRWYPGLNADIDGWGLYQIIPADGLYELELNTSSGDAEDYWPGPLGKTRLDSATNPTSNWYAGTSGVPSGFNLTQITDSSFILGAAVPPPPPPDTVSCPTAITVTCGKKQAGKTVTYLTTLVCAPPSGSFFPVGITTVDCNTCNFTVTVRQTGKQ